MIKRILLLVVGIALVAGAVFIVKDQKGKDQKNQPSTEEKSLTETPSASLTVTLVKPQMGTLVDTIFATGMTIPREEIQVMTELSGVKVTDVLADVGDKVKKGQKLALLDGESFVNQVEQLKSDYERTKDAFNRAEALKNSGATSKQDVTEKYTAMQSAKALLNNAELNLKRTVLISPADGIIFQRNVMIGGLVTGGSPLFRIVRPDDIEVEAKIPESAFAVLKPNQEVSVTFSGQNTPVNGTIRLVTPQIDDTSRMIAIRIQLPETPEPLPVGLFSSVRITAFQREGLLLPKTALQQDTQGDFVWILTPNNKAHRQPVTVITVNDEHMMVESIPLDARIVARAGAFIKDGDSVNGMEGK